jgi:2-polyprenyl-3-methyl-5-hydroxy-6-metoxy-1,4-benzoquinol methylase
VYLSLLEEDVMEQCSICNGNRIRIEHVSNIATVNYCRNCTGLFSNVNVDVNSLYDEDYFAVHALFNDLQIEQSKVILAKVKSFKPHGTLLDYGCGRGVFLKIASDLGFTDCCGADVSIAALKSAQATVQGAPIQWINLSEEAIPHKRFDVISMMDSVAHIPDVCLILNGLIKDHLASDGILVIRTPNITPLYRDYVRLFSLVLPKRAIDRLFFVPNRWILFNKKAIEFFLKRFGIEIISLSFGQDYRHSHKWSGIKDCVYNMVFHQIPCILNPNNSMTVIARKT